MTADCQTKPEAARDRVRRLFIAPLERDGMRFRHGTPPEDQRSRLDRIADDCVHLTDAQLVTLRQCIASKGEGSARCFWPARVTVLGFVEALHPRPLDQVSGLKSWFVSAAGHEAAAVPGRLVAEFGFWRRHKRPPLKDIERQQIGWRASEYAARAERLADREGRDALTDAADREWLARYRKTEAMLRDWLAEAGA